MTFKKREVTRENMNKCISKLGKRDGLSYCICAEVKPEERLAVGRHGLCAVSVINGWPILSFKVLQQSA